MARPVGSGSSLCATSDPPFFIGSRPYGVDLFFALSGFLITGILLDTKGASNYFRSFYARRALRILPLYVCALSAFFFVTLPWLHRIGEERMVSGAEQVWYWSFLMNWHDASGHIIDPLIHFWSLGIEEQFYLVWPLVILICSARYFPAVCLGIVGLSFFARLLLASGNLISPELLGEWIHRATVTRLDGLAMGALVAVIVRREEWARTAQAWVRVVAPAGLAAFVLCWAAGDGRLLNTVGYTATAVGFSSLVLWCVAWQGDNQLLCRAMRLPMLQSFGRYSYAMYVLHIAVRNLLCRPFLFKVLVPLVILYPSLQRMGPLFISSLFLIINLGASYIVGLTSWHLLEKHFLRMKSRLREAPIQQPTGSFDAQHCGSEGQCSW